MSKRIYYLMLIFSVLLFPVASYAQSIYLPLISGGSPLIVTQPPGTIPDIPNVADPDLDTSTGYTTLALDVAQQTTLGRAIDFVDKPPTATQDNWQEITLTVPNVDQSASATFTTGVKEKPCVSIRARVGLTTIVTIACYVVADSTNQYVDAVTALSAIVTTIQQ